MTASKKIKRADTLAFFAFASPWIIGFVLLTVIPMGASLYLSFTNWNILSLPEWVGLKNFKTIFSDGLFYQAIKVTVTYTLITVPLGIALSIIVAILLNNNVAGIRIFRTITYLPAIVSGIVVALLWAWVFNPDFGIINNILLIFKIQGPRWIYEKDWAMPSLVLMSIWGIGANMLIYLAGLQSIPTELYEASHLDGAGFWRRLVYITVPGISPVLMFTLLTGIIKSLQTFTQAYAMTKGGPDNATYFYAYYIYNSAFSWRKMGEACAQAWVLFAIIFILASGVLKATGGHIYYGSAEGDSRK